ncbi:MAG: hypothetical protein ACI9N1_001775 [Flavobacteriales bacterium]|jgi:hypothetical protein
MYKIFPLITLIISYSVVYSQYCSSGGPTTLIDSNVETVLLIGENTDSINFIGCPGVIGVQDLTNQIVYLNSGDPYSLEVQFGTCGGNYSGAGEAWIDFNQNEIFESTESMGTWSGMPPVSLSVFNFTVPSFSPSGNARMRIMQHEAGSLPLDPCASFAWGSVMDFSVYIQNGIDCSTYLGNYIESPIAILSVPYSDTGSTDVCYSSSSNVYNSPDVFYQIIVDSTLPVLNVSLCNSGFDTHLTILNKNKQPILSNDDADNCGITSFLNFETSGHDTLYIVVEGWGIEQGDYILDVYESFTSIEPLTNNGNIIYPNPTSGSVHVKGDTPEFVIVRNMEGKEQHNVVLQKNEINLEHLAPGIYFIEIRYSNTFSVQKVIKL